MTAGQTKRCAGQDDRLLIGPGLDVAAVAITGPAWLLVAGLTRHGFKDLWQQPSNYVTGTDMR